MFICRGLALWKAARHCRGTSARCQQTGHFRPFSSRRTDDPPALATAPVIADTQGLGVESGTLNGPAAEHAPYRTPDDLPGTDPDTDIGLPGRVPVHPRHPARPCTAAGRGRCGSTPGSRRAAESNRRYRYLLSQGVSGLSVAFDLPTQIGYDSDHPLAAGEVGRVGVAIDSIEDMAALFDGIPLDRVSTSMTINATAIILLALYVAVGQAAGRRRPRRCPGTVQNDILKEYVARGTYIYPPRPSLRIVTDIIAFCEREHAAVEPDLDQRLSHPRGGVDGRAGGGVHAGARDAPTSRPAIDRRPRRQRVRPAAVVLLQRAQQLPGGDRQVPRGAAAVGAHHARPLRRDRTRARSSCASTRRPPAAR